MKARLSLVLFFVASLAHAETYLNFVAEESVTTAKEKYPNATFTEIKAGWLATNEKFLQMSGTGIVGKVFLKFSTVDSFWEEMMTLEQSEIDANLERDNAKELANIAYYKSRLARPLDDRLTLDWIRWIPDALIPIARIHGRYGKPDKCDYEQESFRPYCEWKGRGLLIGLTDDKKAVYKIEFSIVAQDYKSGRGEQQPKPETSFELPSATPAGKVKGAKSGKGM
jgi:hypothetical protein